MVAWFCGLIEVYHASGLLCYVGAFGSNGLSNLNIVI